MKYNDAKTLKLIYTTLSCYNSIVKEIHASKNNVEIIFMDGYILNMYFDKHDNALELKLNTNNDEYITIFK